MQVFPPLLMPAVVATIYLIYGAYRDYMNAQFARERLLRERVTYMLWCAAEQID